MFEIPSKLKANIPKRSKELQYKNGPWSAHCCCHGNTYHELWETTASQRVLPYALALTSAKLFIGLLKGFQSGSFIEKKTAKGATGTSDTMFSFLVFIAFTLPTGWNVRIGWFCQSRPPFIIGRWGAVQIGSWWKCGENRTPRPWKSSRSLWIMYIDLAMARSLAIRSSKMLLLCGYGCAEFQIPMRKSMSNSCLGIQTRKSDFLISRFTVCVSCCCWGFHFSLIQGVLSEPDVFGVKVRVTSAKNSRNAGSIWWLLHHFAAGSKVRLNHPARCGSYSSQLPPLGWSFWRGWASENANLKQRPSLTLKKNSWQKQDIRGTCNIISDEVISVGWTSSKVSKGYVNHRTFVWRSCIRVRPVHNPTSVAWACAPLPNID